MEDIRRYCKNYNIITSCDFLDDDLFSQKLVEFYKRAIEKANDEYSINRLARFDRVMRKYIEDYTFSKNLRNSVDVSSIVKSTIDLTDQVLDYAIEFSEKYNDDINMPIVNTRWI